MICKLQRPLFTNAEPTMLVYNESRTFEMQVLFTEDLAELFGDDLKLYARCHMKGGILHVDKLVDDRAW